MAYGSGYGEGQRPKEALRLHPEYESREHPFQGITSPRSTSMKKTYEM